MRCTAVTDSDNGWNRATERIRLPADIYLCLEYLHLGIRRNIRILSYFMKGIKGTVLQNGNCAPLLFEFVFTCFYPYRVGRERFWYEYYRYRALKCCTRVRSSVIL